jgi:hypothetical protein
MNWSPVDKSREIEQWSNRIDSVASNHTQVTGVLAGFSVTVVILIAGIELSGDKAAMIGKEIYAQGAFGLFIAAFFGYVSTGIMYSISIEREKEHQYFLFAVASILYYLSVVLSFSAIVLLTKLVGYINIRPGALLAMASAVIGGYFAAAIPFYDLLKVRSSALLGAFIFSILFGLLLLFCLHHYPGKIDNTDLLIRGLPISIVAIGITFTVSVFSFLDKQFSSKPLFYLSAGFSIILMTTLAAFYAFLMLVV